MFSYIYFIYFLGCFVCLSSPRPLTEYTWNYLKYKNISNFSIWNYCTLFLNTSFISNYLLKGGSRYKVHHWRFVFFPGHLLTQTILHLEMPLSQVSLYGTTLPSFWKRTLFQTIFLPLTTLYIELSSISNYKLYKTCKLWKQVRPGLFSSV